LSIPGIVVSDTISPVGDSDPHTFSISAADLAAAGGQYVVKLSLAGASGTFQARARLFSPSGAELGSELAAGTRDSPRTLSEVGVYTVWVYDSDNNATGAYAIGLEGLNPPSSDAVAISTGDVQTNTIAMMAEVDEYTFTAAVGDRVTLSLADTASASYAPRAVLYSPSGQEVELRSATTGSQVGHVEGGKKVVSAVLAEAGVYVIQVYDNNFTDTGQYRLALEGLVDASEDAEPIVLGEVRSGTIDAGEIDEYTFLASAGDVVTVSLSDVDPGSDTELWAELYSPSGEKVEKLYGTTGPDEVENGEKVVYPLPATGTYVIQVFDGDYAHSEPYAVALEGLKPPSPPPHSVAISVGNTVTGRIEVRGEVDEFTFFASAAQLLRLSFDSERTSDYEPRAMLFTPSGEPMYATPFGPGDVRQPTLTETGTYVIQVYDDDYTHTAAELIDRGKDPDYTVALSNSVAAGSPDDIVGRNQYGYLWVAKSNGSNAFSSGIWGQWSTARTWSDVMVGDFNGDGDDDLVGRNEFGYWWVAASNGSNGFANSIWAKWEPSRTWTTVMVGDFNHDGFDDVVGRNEFGYWWVAASNGAGAFTSSIWGKWDTARTWTDVMVGDFNKDGCSDLVARNEFGYWWVAASNGSGAFANSIWGKWDPARTWSDVMVGDFNSDGADDLIGRNNLGYWWVAQSNGSSSFSNAIWGQWSTARTWTDVMLGDFDGNGAADVVGRNEFGYWWVAKSNGTNALANGIWGQWDNARNWKDVMVGDFNRDGYTDVVGRDKFDYWWVGKSDGWDELATQYWGKWNDVDWLDVLGGDFGE